MRNLRWIAPLLLGIAFAVYGLSRGEAAAVLKKAVSLCFQCIGLG